MLDPIPSLAHLTFSPTNYLLGLHTGVRGRSLNTSVDQGILVYHPGAQLLPKPWSSRYAEPSRHCWEPHRRGATLGWAHSII